MLDPAASNHDIIDWFISETCCLPNCHDLTLLCWRTIHSMSTPVRRGSSGSCLWLHCTVKMKWGSGVDLIRRGRLDKWEWCALLSFVFDALMLHISLFFFSPFSFIPLAIFSSFLFPPSQVLISARKNCSFVLILRDVPPSSSSILSAVQIEWLFWRWACKGQSNYSIWTALLFSILLTWLFSSDRKRIAC